MEKSVGPTARLLTLLYPSSTPPYRGAHLIELRFVAEDGRTIDLQPRPNEWLSVAPLGIPELFRAVSRLGEPLNVQVSGALAGQNTLDFPEGTPLQFNTTVSTSSSRPLFGLVSGGWVPLPWAHKKVAWLDSNLIIDIEKALRSEGSAPWAARDRGIAGTLGLDTLSISPILLAMEGAFRRKLSYMELVAELKRATSILRRALPSSKIDEFSTESRRALYRELQSNSTRFSADMRLLQAAAPLVANTVAPDKRGRVEKEILRIAVGICKERGTPALLALLSCLYESPEGNPASLNSAQRRVLQPGRALIKPKASYGPEDAYNACTDLSFMRLLWATEALVPGYEPVLYTADVGLVAFWTALQPVALEVTSGKAKGRVNLSMKFTLNDEFFQGLSPDEIAALGSRLSAWKADS